MEDPEDYYPFFYWMMSKGKTLYLDADKGKAIDEWGTIVKGVHREEFLVHAWWARMYLRKKKRFEKFVSYAKNRRYKMLKTGQN